MSIAFDEIILVGVESFTNLCQDAIKSLPREDELAWLAEDHVNAAIWPIPSHAFRFIAALFEGSRNESFEFSPWKRSDIFHRPLKLE